MRANDTLSRRAGHAALAGAAGTLLWAAAEELSSRKPVRLGALLILATAATVGLGMAKASSKAYATEQRFNNLLENGGRFGGNVHVAGNHTVDGDHTVGGAVHAGGNVNAGGNFNGGTINLSGNVNADGNVKGAHWPVGAGSNIGNLAGDASLGQVRTYCNNLSDNLNNLRGQMKASNLFN